MNSQFARKLPAGWTSHANVYAALGESHRQRILLLFEPGEEMTIKQIADVLPLSRTAVLHHIRTLLDARLLKRRKEGREVFLRIDTERIESTLTATLDYLRQAYR
jgi:ArsR family transcriptional regulator, arsenate/arsenite/antimonite-responsive transcriptional repressor